MDGNRCWVEIDLSALERNLRKIREAIPKDVQFVSVVKADAYGHGVGDTVARLMRSGVDAFAVANVYEAVEIREIGIGWPVLVLGPVLPEERTHVLDYDLIVTLSSEQELFHWEALAAKRGTRVRAHLKVDTGMGRVGIWHEQAGPLLHRLSQVENVALEGIFTHFSSADSDPEFTELQRSRLVNLLDSIHDLPPNLMVHADNSLSIDSFQERGWFNAIRIGLLQFGCRPRARSLLSELSTEPILRFYSRVGLVKKLPAGTPISYGQTFRLRRNSTVAIVTAGYGDGLATAMSNRGSVLIRGRSCPILGRVTMDQTIVDVTQLPEVCCGDRVTLIGRCGNEEIDVESFSQMCNYVPWETFCSITKRVRRVYKP